MLVPCSWRHFGHGRQPSPPTTRKLATVPTAPVQAMSPGKGWKPCWKLNGLSCSGNWTGPADQTRASSLLSIQSLREITPEQTIRMAALDFGSGPIRAEHLATFYCTSTCGTLQRFSNRKLSVFWASIPSKLPSISYRARRRSLRRAAPSQCATRSRW